MLYCSLYPFNIFIIYTINILVMFIKLILISLKKRLLNISKLVVISTSLKLTNNLLIILLKILHILYIITS